jgi:hypothetical protein
MAGRDGGLVTVTFRCRCGATIRAFGVPALGMLTLRHDEGPRPLALSARALVDRILAGDTAALEEPAIRAWLRGHHRER